MSRTLRKHYVRWSARVQIAWFAVVGVTICKLVGHDHKRISLGEYGYALSCHNCKDFTVPRQQSSAGRS